MNPSADFPRLTDGNHRVTSPSNSDYNCVAWAADDTMNWWQPGVFWPIQAGLEDFGIATLQAALVFLGYVPCPDGSEETGFEKVALYATGVFYTHAARQLPNGNWTSKLGREEDIEHDAPEDVGGGIYGEPTVFMKRAVADSGQ